MDPTHPLAKLQRELLQEIHDLGLYKDAALAAELAQIGAPFATSTLVKWRKGDRTAPLGLLPLLLDHIDDPASALAVLGRPVQVGVVREGALSLDQRGLGDRTLAIGAVVGEMQQAVRRALEPGQAPETTAEIHGLAQRAIRQLQELAALTAPHKRRG